MNNLHGTGRVALIGRAAGSGLTQSLARLLIEFGRDRFWAIWGETP
jgi:hypothetical protein